MPRFIRKSPELLSVDRLSMPLLSCGNVVLDIGGCLGNESLVFLNLTLLATGVDTNRLFLGFGWWLGRPSSQTTVTAGGTLTR